MFERRMLIIALSLAPGVVWSQAARGPNGGRVVVAAGHPIELVVDGLAVTFFLNGENGRPETSRGASGRVAIQQGGQTVTVALAPAEPNRMVGTLAAPLAAGARLLLTGTMGDGHRITARWIID